MNATPADAHAFLLDSQTNERRGVFVAPSRYGMCEPPGPAGSR